MLGFWCRGYCCIKCILFIKISISRLFLNCHLFFIIKDSNYLGDDYKQSSSPYLTLPVINCSSRKPERDCGSLISCLQQSTESPAWLEQMFSVCPPNLLSALLHHFAPCSTSWGCPFLQLLIWFCQWKVPTGDWRDWGRIRATFCQALLWQWPHSLAEGHHGQHAASPSPEALTQAPWELHLSFPLRPGVQRLLLLPSFVNVLSSCPAFIDTLHSTLFIHPFKQMLFHVFYDRTLINEDAGKDLWQCIEFSSTWYNSGKHLGDNSEMKAVKVFQEHGSWKADFTLNPSSAIC